MLWYCHECSLNSDMENKFLNKVFIFVFIVHKKYLHKIKIEPLTILMMSLLPFWALNVSVVLLSMQGQKALEFHKKYLYLNKGLMGLVRHEGE